MCYILLIVIAFFGIHPLCLSTDTIIDEILAVIPHPAGDILVLASDLQMNIDGTLRSFRDVIIDGLMVLKARDVGIAISDASLESRMFQMQKRFNITQDQLGEFFEMQGVSLEEGRELIRRRQMIDELLNIMVRVEEPSKEELERYYQEHPEYEEATYTIQLAFLPESECSSEEVQRYIADGERTVALAWDEPETYAASELSQEQYFVATMALGEVRNLGNAEGGYDLIKLVACTKQQLIPLDESRIAMKVRQQKFLEVLHAFQDELIAKAQIRFCTPAFSRESL